MTYYIPLPPDASWDIHSSHSALIEMKLIFGHPLLPVHLALPVHLDLLDPHLVEESDKCSDVVFNRSLSVGLHNSS